MLKVLCCVLVLATGGAFLLPPGKKKSMSVGHVVSAQDENRRRNRELFTEGLADYKRKDLQAAKTKFLQAEKLIREDFDSWAMLGKIARVQADNTSAYFWLNQVFTPSQRKMASVQKDVGVLYEFLQVCHELKETQRAEEVMQRIVEVGERTNSDEEPFDRTAFGKADLEAKMNIILGHHYLATPADFYSRADEAGETRSAEPFYRRAWELNPDWVYSQYYYGQYLAAFRSEDRQSKDKARTLLEGVVATAKGQLSVLAKFWLERVK